MCLPAIIQRAHHTLVIGVRRPIRRTRALRQDRRSRHCARRGHERALARSQPEWQGWRCREFRGEQRSWLLLTLAPSQRVALARACNSDRWAVPFQGMDQRQHDGRQPVVCVLARWPPYAGGVGTSQVTVARRVASRQRRHERAFVCACRWLCGRSPRCGGLKALVLLWVPDLGIEDARPMSLYISEPRTGIYWR